MALSGSHWLPVFSTFISSSRWLPCSGSQWFSVVTSVPQRLSVVLNGCHAVVLNGSQIFSKILSGSERFSMVLGSSQALPVLLNCSQ